MFHPTLLEVKLLSCEVWDALGILFFGEEGMLGGHRAPQIPNLGIPQFALEQKYSLSKSHQWDIPIFP